MEGLLLRLEFDDGAHEYAWSWRLLDGTGSVMASHAVTLTAGDVASTRVLDLHRNLWRIDPDPGRRAESERAILDPVGDFIGTRLLGGIAEALADCAPVDVVVSVSAANVRVLGYPLELTRFGGASLSEMGVTWCYEAVTHASPPTVPAPTPVRVLALFALPVESSALALVTERRQLVRTVESLGGAVELTVLQYGATRAAFAEAVGDGRGWDVIHVAGHGEAGALHLEREDGGRELVDADVITSLLTTTARTPRLVVLSACETSAARAARRGLSTVDRVVAVPALGNIGHRVATASGCDVIAMRYRVDDRFSVAFMRAFYDGLLAENSRIVDAFHQAVRRAADTAGGPLALATPVLIVRNPKVRFDIGDVVRRPATVHAEDEESDFFVGRTWMLTELGALTSPDGGLGGMALVGMPGIGKTATLAEHVAIHGGRFDRVDWRRMARIGDFTGLTAASLRDERVLIVIDDVHLEMNADGDWKSEDFGEFIATVTAPGGAARVVMASERVVPQSPSLRCVPLPLLARSEAELLARQVAERRYPADDPPETAGAWHVSRGHPGVIADIAGSDDPRRDVRRLAEDWSVFTPPSPRTVHRRNTLVPSDVDFRIRQWVRARIEEQPRESAAALAALCSLEACDRNVVMVSTIFPGIADDLGFSVPDADPLLDSMLECGVSAGLIEHAGVVGYLAQPAVAAAVRSMRPDIDASTVRVMAGWWQYRHDDGQAEGVAGDDLARFAASAVPYLMRLGDWEAASARVEQAIHHDRSPDMAARLISFINEIVTATVDSPIHRMTRFVRATVVGQLDAATGSAAMSELYDEAVRDGDTPLMIGCMNATAHHTAISNPGEALTVVRQAIERASEAAVDPEVLIMLRLNAAKLAKQLGDSDALSAERARELSSELNELVVSGRVLRGVHLPTLRADLLQFAEQVDALPENSSLGGVLAGASGAPRRDLVRAQFNTYAAARRRTGDSSYEDVFAAMLGEYGEREPERALVLGELAEMRWESGSIVDAAELLRRALRIDYTTGATQQAARDHRHLAGMLAAQGDSHGAAVHLLAAGIIAVRVSNGFWAFVPQITVDASAWETKLLVARSPDLVPASYAEVRAAIATDLDVDVDDLLSGSPRIPITVDAETGQISMTWSTDDAAGDSLSDLVALASASPPPAELLDPSRVISHWSELIDLFSTATGADVAQARTLRTLAAAGWTRLSRALRGIGSGESGVSNADLDGVDAAIMELCRQRLSER